MKQKNLTVQGLKEFLINNKISIRNNIITHELTIDGEFQNGVKFVDDKKDKHFWLTIYNCLRDEYDTTLNEVKLYFLALLDDEDCRYNPVSLILDSVPYDDSKDYLAELYDILAIPVADELSKILIKKWLIQCVALSQNTLTNAVGADGMLVLQGRQGIGKTSLIRKLGINDELCKTDTYIDLKDKDTKINALSSWITEIGEIEHTLKAKNIETFKMWITTSIDRYRVPWGTKSDRYPRMTSLVGTCNSDKFLVDETGSRRFWVVPIEHIDLRRLERFDVLSLWKQIEKIYKDKGIGSYRLTPREMYLLQKRNMQHEIVPAEDEVKDILSEAEYSPSEYEMTWLTPTTFKGLYRSLYRYDSRKIGRVLKNLEVQEKRTGKGRFYLLPKPKTEQK